MPFLFPDEQAMLGCTKAFCNTDKVLQVPSVPPVKCGDVCGLAINTFHDRVLLFCCPHQPSPHPPVVSALEALQPEAFGRGPASKRHPAQHRAIGLLTKVELPNHWFACSFWLQHVRKQWKTRRKCLTKWSMSPQIFGFVPSTHRCTGTYMSISNIVYIYIYTHIE